MPIQLKAITPKHMPTSPEYLKAIEGAYYRTVSLVEQDLRSTTRTWDHKPHFSITTQRKGRSFSIAAGTNDPIYGYVDQGTRPHKIRAKRSKYLAFQGGYRAKTRVGIIGSNEGGAFGDTQFRQQVQHPGFPGREFIRKIQRRRATTLRQQVDQAVAEVNRTAK